MAQLPPIGNIPPPAAIPPPVTMTARSLGAAQTAAPPSAPIVQPGTHNARQGVGVMEEVAQQLGHRHRKDATSPDLFRDTPIRYFGFTNELTEAVHPSLPEPIGGILNKFGWSISLLYGFTDANTKAQDAQRDIYNETGCHKEASARGLAVFGEGVLFHGLASWIGPVFGVILPVKKAARALQKVVNGEGPELMQSVANKMPRHAVSLAKQATPLLKKAAPLGEMTAPVAKKAIPLVKYKYFPMALALSTIPFIPKVADPVAEKVIEQVYIPLADKQVEKHLAKVEHEQTTTETGTPPLPGTLAKAGKPMV